MSARIVSEDDDVKRSTAVGHLVEMAEVATERLTLRGGDIGWPLEELWAAGEFLDASDSMEHGTVILLLDVPREDLPLKAIHPAGEWIGDLLRLCKRPMFWSYRSMADPPWSGEHSRVVRFWSAAEGLDSAVIDSLQAGQPKDVDVIAPSDDELAAQLRHELVRSRAHLRSVVDGYWDRDWRHEHRNPEDHLWRAASALSEIQDALDQRGASA